MAVTTLRSASRGVGRRGFTLIEVLLSLSVVLALSALALPSMLRWLDRVEPDAVAQQLSGAVGYCRGDAVRGGKAMTLVAVYDGERCRLFGVALDATSGAAPVSADATGVEAPAADAAGWAGAPTLEELAGAVEYVELPAGAVLVREDPASEEDVRSGAERGGGAASVAAGDRQYPREPFFVAIVLPDGTIVDAGGLPLAVDLKNVGRRRVEINRWTGEAVLGPEIVDTEEGAASDKQPAAAGAGRGEERATDRVDGEGAR